MNDTEREMRDALARADKRAARTGYELRQLYRWLDSQPEEVQQRWRERNEG
jgi:hypothetical protein